MNPVINKTDFGSITVNKEKYDYDITKVSQFS